MTAKNGVQEEKQNMLCQVLSPKAKHTEVLACPSSDTKTTWLYRTF